jgi:phage gp36-like protein
MADYISQADLDVYLSDAVLEQLTDDLNAGSIDTTKVAECIVAAEAEVNSYLAKQYTTPITGTIPEPVKEWSVQLATLRLHQRRLPVPEDVWEMAREVRRQLGLVAKGDLSLDIGDGTAATPDGLEPQFTYNERKFSSSTMDGW